MSKEKFFRPYQAAWDRRHLKQFGTKLTAKQAERVRTACDRAGVTPYKLVQNLLLSWVQNQENAARQNVYRDEFYIRRWAPGAITGDSGMFCAEVRHGARPRGHHPADAPRPGVHAAPSRQAIAEDMCTLTVKGCASGPWPPLTATV